MSALPPKADIAKCDSYVRFVPKAAVSRCSKNPLLNASLFDHLVGGGEQRRGHGQAERLSGLEVDYEFEFGRLNDR
jgi:hypothetical protein